MHQYKLFVQRIGLIGITQILVSFSSIILLPILTKNLSIEEYGMWAQINVTISMVPGLIMLGLPYTLVRFLPALKGKEEIQEAFYSIFFIVLFTSGAASLLLYMFSGQVASRLFDNNIIIVKILSLIIFIECLNSLLLNYLRAREQMKKYSSMVFLDTTSQLLIVSLFVIMDKGILGATVGQLLKTILLFAIISYKLFPEIGIQRPLFRNIKEYLQFGLPTVTGNFSNWIVNSSDRYVIGILLGTNYVGYYSPGYYLGSLINIFIYPFSFVLPTILSKNYDKNNIEEVKTILSYSYKYLMAVSIPTVFGISLLSKPILVIISTEEIASQGYLITPFVAISTLLFGIYTIIIQVVFLEKKTGIVGKIWAIAALLNLGLNFAIIPYMGIIGAALTTLIAFAFSVVITLYYANRILKLDMRPRFLVKTILSSLIMSSIIIHFNPSDFMSIVITVGICALSYLSILFILNGFEERELEFIKKFVNVTNN